jgi:hypothetical protein
MIRRYLVRISGPLLDRWGNSLERKNRAENRGKWGRNPLRDFSVQTKKGAMQRNRFASHFPMVVPLLVHPLTGKAAVNSAAHLRLESPMVASGRTPFAREMGAASPQ